MNEEQTLEKKINDKGLNAPRLQPKDIDAKISLVEYTKLPSNKTMICEITLENGFTVRGDSAIVSIDNFDEEIGKEVAFKNARKKIWELEAYLLQEKLFQEK
jgi:hypothetical protein